MPPDYPLTPSGTPLYSLTLVQNDSPQVLHSNLGLGLSPEGGRGMTPWGGCQAKGSRLRWRLLRLVTTLGVVSLFLVAVSGPASAQGFAQGSNYGYSVGLIPYYNNAAISTTTGYPAEALTTVATYGGFNVSAGYMGAFPIMFYSNGAICREGSWVYNGSASGGFDTDVSPGCGAGPVYYSQGVTAGWTGSAYDEYFTYPSPDENS